MDDRARRHPAISPTAAVDETIREQTRTASSGVKDSHSRIAVVSDTP
jgi:hypothetical protein